MNKYFYLTLSLVALTLSVLIAGCGQYLPALILLSLFTSAREQIRTRLCTVTLSVDVILKDIFDAFQLETPELFGKAGFAKDYSSDSSAIGSEIIGKISHLPVVADYDADNGGFKNGAQDVTTLIEDVPVTLNRLDHVPVKIGFLTGLATKGVDLYKAAVANIGSALGATVVNRVLSEAAVNCSNTTTLAPFQANLDGFETQLRAKANAQKMVNPRFAIIGSAYAAELGSDDRVRSNLFYGQLNGDNGYRAWKNLGGFQWVREYPDIINSGNNIGGIICDPRFALVAVRKIRDMEQAARSLGIRQMMKFYPLRDEDSGLELCGIAWQEAGTGDVYLSVAILYGVHCGTGGGAPGSLTDDAGCLITLT